MFDIVQPDVIGHSLIEIVRHHQIDELLAHCRQLNEPQTTTIEIPARKLYLQATATPLGAALPENTMLLFQNLTRLRRLETVRQDFVSNISHELRTPLASLKALTETLQDSALDDPPAAQRFLARMVTEVDALGQMVEELLELTRIESGRVPLKMSPTPPEQLIADAVERLSLQAERAGLNVEIDCPPDLPMVLADATRLEQVIVNLLHNAIKFTPEGGNICLSAKSQNEMVVFAVQDNGVGIAADDLPRIFERFYKTDRARSGGGTGLGLAIARHLVEAHGGVIWADSIEGQGSTFYFSIPTVD
jgi:two-component system phosphate regulon sensor histidine kinase PhoR